MVYIKKKKKHIFRRIIIVLLAILLAAAVFIRQLNKKLDTLVCAMVVEGLKNTITKIINEAVYEGITESGGGSLIEAVYSDDGKVRSLTVDSARVNLLRTDISRRISEKLDELKKYNVEVSISNVFDDVIFFGRSTYNFSADVVPIGGIGTDIKSEFVSAGINQTNYRLNMTVDVGITAVMLISTRTVEISTSVPVAEMLVVGDVPSVYWG